MAFSYLIYSTALEISMKQKTKEGTEVGNDGRFDGEESKEPRNSG